MSATVNKIYDVFISHAAADGFIAAELAETLESVGLTAFHTSTMNLEPDWGDAIWDALAESRALIAIITPEVTPHAMGMVEIGAATAWNKPVFLIINGPSFTKLPAVLAKYPVFPLSRSEDVIHAIRTGFEPLADDERDILAKIYRELGTPTDQLSQSHQKLSALTTKFNRAAQTKLAGERLLSELIRMRKSGHLPRLALRG